MLVALNEEKLRCFAWLTEKDDGPFVCPECLSEVIIKKGWVKEHHFAHIPPYTCQYGSGESQTHYKAKRELYNHLNNHPSCDKCEVERSLKGVRPDVSLYINKIPVAIEIQRSSIDIDQIIKKAKIYTNLGIYLIYLFPQKEPKLTFHSGEKRWVCRPNQWEKFLHSLTFGRAYYWEGGLNISPVHFGEFHTWVEEKEWPDSYGDIQCGGGYWKPTKTMKIPMQFPHSPLNFVEDFKTTIRKPYSVENWDIPSCKLWLDKLTKWW